MATFLDKNGLSYFYGKIVDKFAKKSELPTNVSELENDSGYLTDYTEIDPTVPSWAKAASKPTYTASEVGAISSSSLVTSIDSFSTNSQVPSAKAVYDAIDGLGAVFAIKGSVSQYSNLPASGNSIGDVYYVENDQTISNVLYPGQVGYIWITINSVNQWEQLGQTIDVSQLQTKITANGILQGDGAGNVTTKTVDTSPTSGSGNLITSGAVYTAILGAIEGSY